MPISAAVIAAPAVTSRVPTGTSIPRISAIRPDAMLRPSASPNSVPTAPMMRAFQHGRGGHPPRRQACEAFELTHFKLKHRHVEAVQDQESADEQRHAGEEVEDHVEPLQLLADLVRDLARGLHVHAGTRDALDPPLQRLGRASDRRPRSKSASIRSAGRRRRARPRAVSRRIRASPTLRLLVSLKMPIIGSLFSPRSGPATNPVADAVAAVPRPVLLHHYLHARGDPDALRRAGSRYGW